MSIRVKLPDGNYGNFPDSMSHEEIESVLQKQFGKPQSSLAKGFSNVGKDWTRFGQDVGAGLLEAARGIGNIPHALHLPNAPYFEPTDFGSMLGMKEQPELLDKLIQGLAQYGPSIALPAANLGRAGQAIESIPKVGQFAAGALEQAIPQAAYGATQNESPLTGALEGGLGSIAGSVIGKGIESGINALRPSQLYKTPLSNKELAQAFRQASGTNTDLGNIIENPALQRLYENKLSKLTGTVASQQQKTGNQIVDKGTDILNKLLGGHSPENVPNQLTDILKKSYSKHQEFKNNIYNAVDDLAKAKGLKLELPHFSEEAKKYMDAIESTNILKHEPDAKNILSKLVNYKNPVKETTKKGLLVDKSGRPLINETTKEYPTLKEANILKGKLGQYAKSYSQSSDADQRHMASIFKNLANRLKTDIKNSIEHSGNETLKKGYQLAEENYAKNYSPFLDKDVYKFISGKADPETIISKFITTSNINDLGGKLSKLAEKLPKSKGTQDSEGLNLLAYGYLSRALDNEGNLNPSKLATAIKKLGPNQLKTLFPNQQTRKELLNYKSLVQKNPRSLQVMFNPLTGQVNSDIHPHALANIVGGLSGLFAGGAPGALLGSVAAPIVNSKIADFAAKKLTDPIYRRKFINALIKNKPYKNEQLVNALQKGIPITAEMIGDNKKPMELEVIGKRK